LVNQKRQHVQFADASKLFGDATELPSELPARLAIELEERRYFAKTARGDSRPVQGLDAALSDLRQFASEILEAFPE
jgi:hypothetical protein